MSFLSVQEIPEERALVTGFLTQAKDTTVQQEASSPKGKGKSVPSLQREKATEDPIPQVDVEGSGSSRDPLATPGGQVSVILNSSSYFYRVHDSAPDGSSPRGYV